jgi:apolipoprotein N-acyltransferase
MLRAVSRVVRKINVGAKNFSPVKLKMKKNFLLCFISGVLTGLSFNSPYLSFFVWGSLVPFIYVIYNSNKLKEGVYCGVLFGLAYYSTAIFWVSKVTIIGLIGLLFYLSFYSALFFLGGRYFLKKPLRLIAIPAIWVILEFVKENIWCGFSWGNLGYSQYRNLYLIQPVDIFGVKFISFIIVMVNVFIWEIFSKKRYVLQKAVLVFLIFLGCFSYSFHRLNNSQSSGSIKVSLIQPNIAEELKWHDEGIAVITEKFKQLSKKTSEDSLVIFPEAAWPKIIKVVGDDELVGFVREIKRKVVMGAIQGKDGRFYNSVFMWASIGNTVHFVAKYYKIKLVPFGEYVPLRSFLGFINAINLIGDMSRGNSYTKFVHKDKIFSVLICFEDIFPNHVSRMAKGRDFLVNITNDGWFEGEPQASQHLAIMALRAIENRIPIVRCANTGISGWVSSIGEIKELIQDGKKVLIEGVGEFDVALNKGGSFYNSYGEIFPIFCGMVLLIIFIRKNER